MFCSLSDRSHCMFQLFSLIALLSFTSEVSWNIWAQRIEKSHLCLSVTLTWWLLSLPSLLSKLSCCSFDGKGVPASRREVHYRGDLLQPKTSFHSLMLKKKRFKAEKTWLGRSTWIMCGTDKHTEQSNVWGKINKYVVCTYGSAIVVTFPPCPSFRSSILFYLADHFAFLSQSELFPG